jgi:predicted  nucleic acid-binding Zn-ribbon protein
MNYEVTNPEEKVAVRTVSIVKRLSEINKEVWQLKFMHTTDQSMNVDHKSTIVDSLEKEALRLREELDETNKILTAQEKALMKSKTEEEYWDVGQWCDCY